MKCTIPEISWHNRDPVLSVDIQVKNNDTEDFCRLATGGTDSHVLIWHVKIQDNGAAAAEFAADLTRHQRAVNVVRFSPSGEFLASGDDESAIIVWKQKTDSDCPEFPGGEVEGAKEQWLSLKVLRGHVDDVYDLSWSPDSRNLISGSVDNLAILWDVQKGSKTALLQDHKGFVQGVAWDPKNQLVATMSSDRKFRVFNVNSKKVMSRTSRSLLPVAEGSPLNGVTLHLYHDDTFKSFFRRLCFSPDGNLLITPSGFIEEPSSNVSCNATYIYTRKNLSRPCVYLPSNEEYTIAVRCSPVLYELRATTPERPAMFELPYRMVIAVAEQKSVVLYDTQQNEPFAVISNIHYTRLTDLAWSSDGRLLIISSTDGYCSIVTFGKDELGAAYSPKQPPSTSPPPPVAETDGGPVARPSPKQAARRIQPVSVSQGSQPDKKTSCEAAGNVSEPLATDGEVAMEVAATSPEKSDGDENPDKTNVEAMLVSPTRETNLGRCDDKTPVQAAPTTPQRDVRTPRRVGFVTISSPKSKKNLVG